MNKIFNVRQIVLGALIAAIYFVLTVAIAPLSYGIMQIRFSEALTVLPFFFPGAIPGLFIGCLLANIMNGNILDIIFGSLATLLAAFTTYKIKNKYLAPLPPIIFNAVIVGAVLTYIFTGTPDEAPFYFIALSVGFGELIACYALGLPLLLLLEKFRDKLKL